MKANTSAPYTTRLQKGSALLKDMRLFARSWQDGDDAGQKRMISRTGYNPHIGDGVLLNMAPLWELVPAWQAEPKKAWESLERGDYDWAQQAMDHWPDRVREQCRTNKSFAIAQGFFSQEAGG
jgi:hypothetical protein